MPQSLSDSSHRSCGVIRYHSCHSSDSIESMECKIAEKRVNERVNTRETSKAKENAGAGKRIAGNASGKLKALFASLARDNQGTGSAPRTRRTLGRDIEIKPLKTDTGAREMPKPASDVRPLNRPLPAGLRALASCVGHQEQVRAKEKPREPEMPTPEFFAGRPLTSEFQAFAVFVRNMQ